VTTGNLFEQQAANRRRSALLVVLFFAFFAWVGFGGDLVFHLATADATGYRHTIPWFGIGTTLLAAGLVRYSWKRGPKEVLWSTGAWELLEPVSEKESVLVNVVEEMAIASGQPRPTIWIVPDPDPNAFATGTDPHHAHIAVTEGLLALLPREELQGVVAHEMAHVRNDDVKLMTLLAALVGVLALIADGSWRMIRFGRVTRGGPARTGSAKGAGKKGGSPLFLILLVVWLASVIVAPFVSQLLALTVSRKREFLADATAAQFTRNPMALANALRHIEHAPEPTKAIRRGTAHLCIADPLGRRLSHRDGWLASVFASHPPMGVRVARLKAMAYQHEKTGSLPEPA
jgi:heat shock protein HtpX